MAAVTLDFRPISGALGAEVYGIDLSAEIDDATFSALRQAWHEHLILFFHDQTLTPDQLKTFGRRFGPLDIDRFVLPGMPEHPEIIVVKKTEGEKFNFGNRWHADMTSYEKPLMASALYALEVPPYGGDTLFANMYLAYETLSPGMKKALDGLRAVHSVVGGYDLATIEKRWSKDSSIQVRRDREDEAQKEAIHPVVRVHPDTGRKCLFVNRIFTKRFEAMTAEESEPLLEMLYAHLQRPEFTCRFRWRKGSLALWDNRCAQHYANNDYHGFRRVMHRVAMQELRPV